LAIIAGVAERNGETTIWIKTRITIKYSTQRRKDVKTQKLQRAPFQPRDNRRVAREFDALARVKSKATLVESTTYLEETRYDALAACRT